MKSGTNHQMLHSAGINQIQLYIWIGSFFRCTFCCKVYQWCYFVLEYSLFCHIYHFHFLVFFVTVDQSLHIL